MTTQLNRASTKDPLEIIAQRWWWPTPEGYEALGNETEKSKARALTPGRVNPVEQA